MYGTGKVVSGVVSEVQRLLGCCAYREGRGNSACEKESVEMSLLNGRRGQQVKMKGVEIELMDFVGQGRWEARR